MREVSFTRLSSLIRIPDLQLGGGVIFSEAGLGGICGVGEARCSFKA